MFDYFGIYYGFPRRLPPFMCTQHVYDGFQNKTIYFLDTGVYMFDSYVSVYVRVKPGFKF